MRRLIVTALVFVTSATSSAELSPADYSNVEHVEIRAIRFETQLNGEKRAVVAIKNDFTAPISVRFTCSSFSKNGEPEDSAFGNVPIVPPRQEVVSKSSRLAATSEKVACYIGDVGQPF
jgi:hypothetical protein